MDLEWLLSVDIKQEITRLKKENDKMADQNWTLKNDYIWVQS